MCAHARDRRVAAAVSKAERSFRGLSFHCLRREDLREARVNARPKAYATLADDSKPTALGKVDAFISHSWLDSADERYDALHRWSKRFEAVHHRPPIIWFDKACIDQSDIDESLKVLPVYLAGCKELVVLAGPTYTRRLWCIIEAFTFLRVGTSVERMHILPLAESKSTGTNPAQTTITISPQSSRNNSADTAITVTAESSQGTSDDGGDASWKISEPMFSPCQIAELKKRFAEMRVESARCHASDEEPLHAVIRTGFTSLADFDQICSSAFLAALELSAQQDAEHVERDIAAQFVRVVNDRLGDAAPALPRGARKISHEIDSLKKKFVSRAAAAIRWGGEGSSSGPKRTC